MNLRRMAWLWVFCAGAASAAAAPRALNFRVLADYPHDRGDFTQGLFLDGDSLIESTGLPGRSVIARKRVVDGRSLRRVPIEPAHFGEGATRLGARIFQLTWLDGIGYIYDAALRPLGRFRYRGEGWGLTSDGRSLIVSDGSDRLRYLDPASFAETRTLAVTERGVPVTRINELEFARAKIWANVWMTDRILVIDPSSGEVTASLDLSALQARLGRRTGEGAGENVLNGIAWDAARDEFLVTGKRWPKLFRIAVE